MISRILHILLIILLVTLQLSLGQYLGIYTPELVLAGTLAICLTGDILDTIWWVALGGLLLDLTIGSYAGLYLILMSGLSYALLLFTRQVFQRPPLIVGFIVLFIFTLVFELIAAGIGQYLGWYIFVPAILTAICGTIAYGFLLTLMSRREAIRFV